MVEHSLYLLLANVTRLPLYMESILSHLLSLIEELVFIAACLPTLFGENAFLHVDLLEIHCSFILSGEQVLQCNAWLLLLLTLHCDRHFAFVIL